MSKIAKVAIGAAVVLVVGLIISGITIFALAKRGTNSDATAFVTTEFDVDEDFSNINIDVIADDILIKTSSDDKCHVECVDYEEIEHDAYVDGDTLFVTSKENGTVNAGLNIMFNTTSPKITVYLPENVYEDFYVHATTGDLYIDEAFTFTNLRLDATTGDISINSLNCTDAIEMNITTGDIDLTDVECGTLVYNGVTGDIDFINVVASGDLSVEVTTGDINFDMCDAANIYVDCTTGDVDMTLLSDKEFDVDAELGDTDYPRSGEGGVCRVSVTTGDVDIEVA